jgi:acyl-CoA thioester hydrolase
MIGNVSPSRGDEQCGVDACGGPDYLRGPVSRRPARKRFNVKIPVRFRDLDPMGHVNNSVYLTYFEVGRTAYWQELHHDYRYDVLDFVVARSECDYVSAAILRETIRVEVWLSRIGTSSFVLDYELFDEQSERLVARGKTVQVMIDPKTGRPRSIEPELRERMRSFAEHWGGGPEE